VPFAGDPSSIAVPEVVLASTRWPMFKHDPNHSGLSQYDTGKNIGLKLWQYKTGGAILSSPIQQNEIVVTSDDGNIYTVDQDGSLISSAKLGTFSSVSSAVRSAPAVAADGRYYVGSADGKALVASSRADGTRGWNFKTGGAV
jgi:outer membrane protein assembly factor BamB